MSFDRMDHATIFILTFRTLSRLMSDQSNVLHSQQLLVDQSCCQVSYTAWALSVCVEEVWISHKHSITAIVTSRWTEAIVIFTEHDRRFHSVIEPVSKLLICSTHSEGTSAKIGPTLLRLWHTISQKVH